MASRFVDRRARLDVLLAVSTAVLQRRFLDGVRRLRADRVARRLAREGRTVELLTLYRGVAEDVANALQEEIQRSAREAAGEIGAQLRVPLSLDASRFRVGATLRSQRERLLADLVLSQTRTTQVAARSDDPDLILASLGLSERGLASLVRYRDLLTRGAREAARRPLGDPELQEELRADLDDDRPPDEDQADLMAGAYSGVLLASGSLLLAGWEAQVALGQGIGLALGQAFDDGVLDPETLTQTWRTRRDELVRPSHRAMQGQVRRLGEPFRSGDGNALRYPGDENAPASDRIRCRCVVVSGAGVPARAGVS